MAKAKAEALELIKKLPDDVTTGAIMEELFFKQQVEKGLQDVAEGRVLTHEELKERKNRSMAQVRWSLTAGNDLQYIENFIARDSILHAITFVDRVVESAETLLKTPQIGRIVPEFNRADLRELIFREYRIVYLVQDSDVLILRVVHGSRDLLALVRREPWDVAG